MQYKSVRCKPVNTTSAKIIVVVGPTASGKSALAVLLGKRYHGEVISADSRQVYRGMNLGSGKVTKREMAGVPHHLLDVADPKRTFTAARFAKLGRKAIQEIIARRKTPIICGGTGFYIRALVDGIVIPDAKPNPKLRKALEKKTTEELFALLTQQDPDRAATIDPRNPRRLIRALEIVDALGKVPKLRQNPLPYPMLFIGIAREKETLKTLIEKRLKARVRLGMISEIKKLHANGVSWKRLESFGLEYRYGALLLQKKIDRETFVRELTKQILDYAKRQMTWFKADKRIQWVDTTNKAISITREFIDC